MGKRKFSFDIPRLKINGTRADFRAIKEHLGGTDKSALDDSPPPTPKSVRPPLSPQQDAELRAACTMVLQGGEAAPGNKGNQRDPAIATLGAKPQLDYAAIRNAPPQAQPSRTLSRKQPNPRRHDASGAERRAESPPQLSPEAYRYKPGLNSEELMKQLERDEQEKSRLAADSRAEQLMGGKAPKPSPSEEAARDRSEAHKRSQSTPQTLSMGKPDALSHRPKNTIRTESTESTSTHSHADTTDGPHSTSTALTSAYVTPAKGSQRASSQGLDFKSSNLQKVDNAGGDSMTEGSEKHKHEGEENKYGDKPESEDTITSSDIPIAVTKVPVRKPVAPAPSRAPSAATRPSNRLGTSGPARSASVQSSESEVKRNDSKHFIYSDLLRSRSTKAPTSPRSDGRQSRDNPQKRDWRDMHSLSNQEGGSKGMRRARSFTKKVQEYVRPASDQGEQRSESRTRSRSRSVARHVQEYFRPGSATGSRAGSIDGARPSMQKTKSQNSETNGSSGVEALPRTASQKWREWQPPSGDTNQNVSSQQVVTEPRETKSKDQSKRRQEKPQGKRKPHQKSTKPPVDLNRELPPLPALDKWEDDGKSVTIHPPAVKVDSPGSTPKRSSRQSRPKMPRKHVSAKEVEDILMARMGTPTQQRSNNSSVDESKEFHSPIVGAKGAVCSANNPWQDMPPQPSAPPPPPPIGNTTRPGNQDDQTLSQRPSYQSASVADQIHRHSRQRSKSLHNPMDQALGERRSVASPTPVSPITPDFNVHKFQPSATGSAQIVNMSRFSTKGPTLPANPSPHHHGRKPSASVSSINHPYTTPPTGHSRNPSQQTANSTTLPPPRSPRDNSKRHSPEPLSTNSANQNKENKPTALNVKKWFPQVHRNRHKDPSPKSESWMDHVVKSGANSGAIVLPENEGETSNNTGAMSSNPASPSVRY
ncbi:hypothetical protein MBLNU230_g7921t1 [Neophaeotheca triangularis]